MGQRHQIFLRVVNPLPALKKHGYTITPAQKKMFGIKETTVLAFHNQWLFGLSALYSALNILTHCSQFSKNDKLSDNGAMHSPFTKDSFSYQFKDINKWITAIEFIMNYMPRKTSFNHAGFLESWYLNDADMNKDFTLGDNNDGITIIDTIENKYCFMNINKVHSAPDATSRAMQLPYLKPCNAHEYIIAYYGETVESCNPYYFKKNSKVAPEKIVANHAKDNNKMVKKFAKYELLTVDEIGEMFPNVKIELVESNLNLVD